jgi:hypothetical protein
MMNQLPRCRISNVCVTRVGSATGVKNKEKSSVSPIYVLMAAFASRDWQLLFVNVYRDGLVTGARTPLPFVMTNPVARPVSVFYTALDIYVDVWTDGQV